jgi:hypothetical protein
MFDGIKPGIVIVESVWPNGAFEEGIGINLLTSAEPAAPDGGAVFHDTAVWIRPEPGECSDRADGAVQTTTPFRDQESV